MNLVDNPITDQCQIAFSLSHWYNERPAFNEADMARSSDNDIYANFQSPTQIKICLKKEDSQKLTDLYALINNLQIKEEVRTTCNNRRYHLLRHQNEPYVSGVNKQADSYFYQVQQGMSDSSREDTIEYIDGAEYMAAIKEIAIAYAKENWCKCREEMSMRKLFEDKLSNSDEAKKNQTTLLQIMSNCPHITNQDLIRIVDSTKVCWVDRPIFTDPVLNDKTLLEQLLGKERSSNFLELLHG